MNMAKAGFLVGLAFSLCGYGNARAELKWDQTILELHPKLGEQEAIGHFKYQNAGKTPVRFKSVRTSCGCTAAQSQREEVPPGEKGEITATFKIGDRTGTQVKTVTVETDDPSQNTTVLTLKAVLPEMLTIIPTFVFWAPNEEPKSKTLLVKAGKDFPAQNLSVTSANPEFVAKVEPAGTGQWKINVQPKQTAHSMAGLLTIKPDYPKDAPKLFYANVSVVSGPVGTPAAAIKR
jgi:hypothetical protein